MTGLTDNPLYRRTGLPAFDRIRPEHVEPALAKLIEEAEAALAELEQSIEPTWASAIEAVDAIDRPLDDAWSPVRHLMAVKNSPELREAYEAMQPGLVALGLKLAQSEAVFHALEELGGSDRFEDATEGQKRVVTARLRSMRLAGVGLTGDAKKRFNEIAQSLSELSTQFSNNVLDATKAWSHTVTDPAELSGLSDDERRPYADAHNRANEGAEATPADGPYRLTLDYPAFRPILENCQTRELRERVYRGFVGRAGGGEFDNTAAITQILRLRKEKAALLGFRNYGDMAMTAKMADVDSAKGLLEELRDASWEPGRRDIDQLRAFAGEQGHEGDLANWDIRYYRERLREERFGFNSEELRPYFPMPRVLDGLFGVVRRLFGVDCVAADGETSVWHSDVSYFRIEDGGETIASFYLDPYARPENKRGGAWMASAQQRRLIAGNLELPTAYVTCNGTPPSGERPSLMSFNEVLTLFHEFGHALQHMLTTVDYESISGIGGVEWDAVELPSQFMENWCYHWPTVSGMTAHVDTGEQLPRALFDKVCAAKNFFAGHDFLRQLFFGLTDLKLHTEFDPEGSDPYEVREEVARATQHVPLVDGDRTLHAFSHIFAGGYAAGYYSYKWAEVLSADAFDAFEGAGLGDDEAVERVGRRFRETVLSQGGSRHPSDVYRDFRGRDATKDALLRHNGLQSGAS